jgi:hypothetical protein
MEEKKKRKDNKLPRTLSANKNTPQPKIAVPGTPTKRLAPKGPATKGPE